MAFTYERKDSPWLWVCFLDAVGKRRRKSTEIRKGTPETARKAKRLEAEYNLRENELPRAHNKAEAWENWVPDYLAERYEGKEKTLARARQAWAALTAYFEAKTIRAPRALDYAAVAAYLKWRRSAESGLRIVSHNTARLELTFLKVVMSEAVRKDVPGGAHGGNVVVLLAECCGKLSRVQVA